MYHHRSLVRPLGVALFGGRSDPLEKRIITQETGKNRGLRRLRIACLLHSWVSAG